MTATPVDDERSDLLASLAGQRDFLLKTVKGLTDEQVVLPTTPSELCLGGIIKHVAYVEQGWAEFIRTGVVMGNTPEAYEAHANSFKLLPGETLESILESYAVVAANTEELITSLTSLDARHLLPEAPWFPPGTTWSDRTVLLHILAETAQHSGHADIIREALDGSKTMG
jgi:hypothetical protein